MKRITAEAAPERPAHPSVAPSPAALIFCLLAVLVPILLQKPMLNSDGDLARHLAHGRYMLAHGGVIRLDPFSYTRPGASFVGFEYGSQLAYALAERLGGLPGVAILAGLLLGLTYTILAKFLLDRVDPLLACLIVGMAIVLGAGYWGARPHLFSFLAVVVLLTLLEGARPNALWKTGVLFGLWSNLHGGFVYGWGLILVYLIGSVGEMIWGERRKEWKTRVQQYGWMLVIGVLATILNPYGLQLHRHLIQFFSTPYLMEHTTEFVSPNFHEGGGKILLAVLVLSLLTLALHRPRPTLPRLFLVCAGAASAMMAVRNIPLFGLTALPVLAIHLDGLWRRLPDPRGLRARFEITARTTSTLPWIVVATVLMSILAWNRGLVGSRRLIQDGFDPTIFPVAAVAEARRHDLQGRLFSEFVWGGYVVYAWPEQKVFIDGGTDFFGEDIFREYLLIKQMIPGWRDSLAKRDISLMLLEREKPFTHEALRDGTWTIWHCDSLAVLLHRSSETTTATSPQRPSGEQALETCAKNHPSRSASPIRDSPQGRERRRRMAASS